LWITPIDVAGFEQSSAGVLALLRLLWRGW
jgi:hypothetical protein